MAGGPGLRGRRIPPMRPLLSARPRVHGEVAGIDFEWVLETPLVRLSRWRCLERAAGVTGERHQLWRVIGFVHEGAFAVRTPRGGGLVDSLSAVLLNRDEPYTTSHPCGVGDHGSGLVLRQDLFDEILERRHPRAAEDGRRLPPSAPCPTTALARHRRLLRAAETPEGADPLGAEEAALAIAEEILGAAAAARPAAPGDSTAPGAPAGSADARHHDLAEGVRTHLGREFRTPLRLEGIAAALGSTPAHLCRGFRRV